MCLWSIHELAKANKLCGPLLAKLPPDIWEAVVRWLEFIHPMHDHLRPSKREPSPTNVTTCFAKLFDIILRVRVGPCEKILLENPRAVLLFLDYWLCLPKYMGEPSPATAEPCTTLIIYMFLLLDRNRDATLESLVVADLVRLVGGSAATFWRLFAKQTAYLAQLPFEPAWPLVWEKHFELATRLCSVPELQCLVMPRTVI